MSRERSPNYPVYNLPAAIQYARMIWDKEKRTPTEMEVLAKALGSRVVSGPVRSKVSSMRQYGLLESSQQKYKVTDRAITLILERPGQPEYDKAVEAAALAPALFKDLRDERPDASVEALNIYLIRDRGFSTEGAKKAITSYRLTMDFAKLGESSYTPSNEVQGSASEPETVVEPERRQSVVVTADQVKKMGFSFTLPSGVKADVTFSGRFPTKRDVQRLLKHLELFEADLPEGEPELRIDEVATDESVASD